MRPLLLFVLFVPMLFATGPCVCNPQTVWLDVMILFDSSSATTNRGLQEMLGYVQTAFSFVNVQNSSCTDDFHTRIGVIAYASNATLLYPLGSINGEEFEDIPTIPFFNQTETNIESAINLATTQFNTTAHRDNVRRVIFLLGTAYNDGDYNSPQQVASAFREANGIIVVYNYEQQHGVATPELEEIVSPGFFIANYLDRDGSKARKALCDSNCFCPNGLSAFSLDPITQVPTTGCFYGVNIGTGEQYAEVRCNLYYNGQMAKADSQEKTNFLYNLFISQEDFWTSLRWNSSLSEYQWADGSVLQSNSSYQPWSTGSTKKDGLDCVGTKKNTLLWMPMDCRTSLFYACENIACDSTNYCSIVQ